MKKITFIISLFLSITYMLDAQDFEWAYIYGEASFSEVEVDQFNNIYVCSYGDTTIDFSLDYAGLLYGPTNGCGAIMKFDPNGSVIWTKFIRKLSGFGQVRPRIVKAKDNFIYIAGNIDNQIGAVYDFDPGPGSILHTSTHSNGIFFVLKLDLDGNYVWHNAVMNAPYPVFREITIDADHNIYVCGDFRDFLVNDSTIYPYMGVAGSVIAKYNSTGHIQWLNHFDATFQLNAYAIEMNSTNKLYVAGYFSDSVHVKVDTTVTGFSGSQGSAYVLKIDTSGTIEWFKNYGNDWFFGMDMEIDSYDNLLLLGYNPNVGQLDLDPSINSSYLMDSAQTVLTKWDSAANVIWSQGYKCTNLMWGVNLSLDPNNRIAISGNMRGACDFDLSNNSYNLATNYTSGTEPFVITLEAEGDFKWAGLLHNIEPSYTYSWGLCWAQNALYVGGAIEDMVDFDPDSVNSHILSSTTMPFGSDYLLKLNTTDSSNTFFVDACDDYFWTQTNQTYINSGTYVDSLIASNGDDSLITLNLNVFESYEVNVVDTACDEYWIGNMVYNTSGLYSQTMQSVDGCDSIIHLDLTMNYSPDPVIELENGNTLITELLPNASYQWIDCVTLTPVSNETNNVFTPGSGGSYAVVVGNACGTDTSDCFSINARPELQGNDVMVSPNPTQDFLLVEGLQTGDVLQFYSVLGKEIFLSQVSENPAKYSLAGLRNGIYYLSVRTGQGLTVFKVLKH